VNKLPGELIPLLLKEGWPRHQKMIPFRKGADGVVSSAKSSGLNISPNFY